MTTRPQKHGAFVIRLKTVGLILFLLWLTFPPLGASQKQLLSVSFVSDHPPYWQLGLAVYNSIYEMKMEWKPVMAKPKGSSV